MATLERDIRVLRASNGVLCEIESCILRCLIPHNRHVHREAPSSSVIRVTEWNVFEASIYAMVGVLRTMVDEPRMRVFERICTSMRMCPVHLHLIAGAPARAAEFLQLASDSVKIVRLTRRAKRMVAQAYLSIRMRTKVAIDNTDVCSICMRCVHHRHVVLDCGHVFHRTCVLTWICHSKICTCPVCRQRLSLPSSS